MMTLKKSQSICREFGFTNWLTLPNASPKLIKSNGMGFYNAGIGLAQANLSATNNCTASTPDCRKLCLGNFGRAEFLPQLMQTRINRSNFLHRHRQLAWQTMLPQLMAIDRRATRNGLTVAFRPDITSDKNWDLILPQLFATFPNWKFYGYTKLRSKITRYLNGSNPMVPTFSWSERLKSKLVNHTSGDDYPSFLLENGINIAVVFYDRKTLAGRLPRKFLGRTVIDGDKHDLRFLDPRGVIVGLKPKLPKSKVKARQLVDSLNGFFVSIG